MYIDTSANQQPAYPFPSQTSLSSSVSVSYRPRTKKPRHTPALPPLSSIENTPSPFLRTIPLPTPEQTPYSQPRALYNPAQSRIPRLVSLRRTSIPASLPSSDSTPTYPPAPSSLLRRTSSSVAIRRRSLTPSLMPPPPSPPSPLARRSSLSTIRTADGSPAALIKSRPVAQRRPSSRMEFARVGRGSSPVKTLIRQWESGVDGEKGWYGEMQQTVTEEKNQENVDVDVAVDLGVTVAEERGRGSLRGIKRLRERSAEPRVCAVR
ncbi:hypothetical protein BOTBODRAFT_477890 [Botryobasidium botryosum FD-172 SS1]|uniref:Uncharacterized protein n=1 Tax=Botryobasidium botryosum (strain FD-172 SS1) TaxID=930990 RepID=A0A067MTG7_BOTB1|nr:hypothetical protein BOTBODRAFT_477890 [Botryobasidium botryosum FD-172 SS1]